METLLEDVEHKCVFISGKVKFNAYLQTDMYDTHHQQSKCRKNVYLCQTWLTKFLSRYLSVQDFKVHIVQADQNCYKIIKLN